MKFIKKYGILIVAILLIVGALLPYICTFYKYGISQNSDQWDHFGSYIGGIFSGLAFIGVIYQLHTTRLDQKKQDFERTFFMLLEQHNLKLNTLGQTSVDKIYSKIISNYESISSLRAKLEISEYVSLYSEINSYFLFLYRVLKFIHENEEFNKKNNYSSLLRSFISNKLLVILAYHVSNRDQSYEKYIEYINKFSFLEHINFIDLEIEFVSSVTGIEKTVLYDLLVKKDERLIKATEKGKLTPDEPVRDDTLKEILRSKLENRHIKCKNLALDLNFLCIKEGETLKAEISHKDHVFFKILKTFSQSAFGKNNEYSELVRRYKPIFE